MNRIKKIAHWKTWTVSLVLAAGLLTSVPANGENLSLEGDMVFVPAGQFLFGANEKDSQGEALALGIPKPWYADEGPQQKPFLKGFYIDRYEVTNRRYKTFIDNTGAVGPPHWENNSYPKGQADFPVVWVNWYDAANFCGWTGKHLPTEKEWEKTARGPDGNIYPWGNKFKRENANLPKRVGDKTKITKVGSFAQGATPLGVHDLVGNVWEWVNNDYEPYKNSAYKNPAFGETNKVLRGASAADIGHFPGELYLRALEKFSRSGYRQFAYPDEGAADVGFRCASESKPKTLQAAAQPKAPSDKNFDPENSEAFKILTGQKGSAGPTAKTEKAPPVDFNPFEVKPNLPESGMLVLIFLSLIAGLLSFMSPCTLPILPAYFAVTAQADRARMSLMSFAFFCGLASLFVLMGASASFIGQLLRDYIFSLTKVGGVLVGIFGVMTLFGKGFSGANFKSHPASTFFGYYLFGATFAMGWTPCVGPVLSGILILAASDKTVFEGMSLLFFYAVGLGMPLILIASVFSHLSKDGWFWKVLRGKGWNITVGGYSFILHSTNLFSGLLLIGLGIILWAGYLTYFNSLLPIEMQIWFSHIEEAIMKWFM